MNPTMSKKIPSYQNVIGYRALSIGFLYPTEKELERLKNMATETLNQERLGSNPILWNGFNELLPMIPNSGSTGELESLDLLQEEHFRLFGPNPIVYLDLAFYFSDNPFEQSKKMADMAGFLLAFGVNIEDGNRVDNLSVCLDFLSYLHLKWLNAEEKGLSEQGEMTQKAIRSYVQDFLVCGVRSFHQKLAERSQSNFYKLLGRIALESVTGEQK